MEEQKVTEEDDIVARLQVHDREWARHQLRKGLIVRIVGRSADYKLFGDKVLHRNLDSKTFGDTYATWDRPSDIREWCTGSASVRFQFELVEPPHE